VGGERGDKTLGGGERQNQGGGGWSSFYDRRNGKKEKKSPSIQTGEGIKRGLRKARGVTGKENGKKGVLFCYFQSGYEEKEHDLRG